jgi:hypothetical protein
MTPNEIDGEDRGADDQATCSCGYDRNHHMVSAKGDYTLYGSICLIMGISAHPIKVRYMCRMCHDVIAESTDPKALKDPRLL